jgi:adenylylsulfate kinase-like enzyme
MSFDMMTTFPDSIKIAWLHATVTRESLEAQNGHCRSSIRITRLSRPRKSKPDHAAELLHPWNCSNVVLDGGNVRHGLEADVDFSGKKRQENIRRVGEVTILKKWLMR